MTKYEREHIKRIKESIAIQKNAITKLNEVKDYIYHNFAAPQKEIDSVCDAIARVKDSHEEEIKRLKTLLIASI